MSGPNYSTYSTEQLLDAYNNIDKERFPERVEQIEAELERKGVKLGDNQQIQRMEPDNVFEKPKADPDIKGYNPIPQTLDIAGDFIVKNLHRLLIGVLIGFVDFVFKYNQEDGSVKEFDLVNDLFGLVIILIAVNRLRVLPSTKKYRVAMGFVTAITALLLISSIIDQFFTVGELLEQILGAINILEVTGLITFCYAMKLLSEELNLSEISRLWSNASLLYFICGLFITIFVIMGLLISILNLELPSFVLQTIAYSMIPILVTFLIAFGFNVFVTYKMKKVIQDM